MIFQITVSDSYPINKDNSKIFRVNCQEKIVNKNLFLGGEGNFVKRKIFIKPVEYYLSFEKPFVWLEQIGDSMSNLFSNTIWKLIKK